MKTLNSLIFQKETFSLFFIFISLIAALLITGCSQTDGKIPTTSFKSEIPDFSVISDINEKKRSFFNFMGAIIKEENAKVSKERVRLLLLYSKHINNSALSVEELTWLENLRKKYKGIKQTDNPEVLWTSLFKRVDILPLELALTQAANESGWGSSRFARRGNNLFGQWCFQKGCGLIPTDRDPDAIHEVKKFDSVRDSVRSYIHNLNTNDAYSDFRNLRLAHRQMGITPDGYSLVSELPNYSIRGEAYIEEIRSMILVNMPHIDS